MPEVELTDCKISLDIEYQVHCESCGEPLITDAEWEGGILMISVTPCENCTEG